LLSGDVITSINKQSFATPRELIRKIASLPVGSAAVIGYVRNGEAKTASVTLEERQESAEEPSDSRRPRNQMEPLNPRSLPNRGDKQAKPKVKQGLGANTRTLTPELAKENGLEGMRGAFVMSVDPGSTSEDGGLLQDDLIVDVNNHPVSSAEDFQRIVRDLHGGDDVVIKVLRKNGAVRRAFLVSFTMP
jgi:S1-C subfamily serine protease